jgi:hypothetical protein
MLGRVIAMFLGGLLFRLGLYMDEGPAWSGIGLGVPIGITFAIIAFIYTF